MANKNIDKKDLLQEEIEENIIKEEIHVEVKKKKFKVISYNPKSKIIVVERDSKRYQCNNVDYDGISKEIELDII